MSDDSTLGPDVLIVRRTFEGEEIARWVPALLAVDMLLNDDDNGLVYEAAWVVEDTDNNLSGWLISGCRLMEIDGE